MLGKKRLLLDSGLVSSRFVPRLAGRSLLLHETRKEAEHEGEMVVGLPADALGHKSVAAVGGARRQRGATEHVTVGLNVERLQTRRLGSARAHEKAQPLAAQLAHALGEGGILGKDGRDFGDGSLRRNRAGPIDGQAGSSDRFGTPAVHEGEAPGSPGIIGSERRGGELAGGHLGRNGRHRGLAVEQRRRPGKADLDRRQRFG